MNDNIENPKHYQNFTLETIDIINLILSRMPNSTPFESYCMGNELKYRLRAGFKGDILEDIGKALKYKTFRDDLK